MADTLVSNNLAVSKAGPGRLANSKARKKVDKYGDTALAVRAVHLPFAVETLYRTWQHGPLSNHHFRNCSVPPCLQM